MWWWIAGCVDYHPFHLRDGDAPDVPEQTCDGVDDDQDGVIDDGLLDDDDDGVLDCLECGVAPAHAEAIAPNAEACGGWSPSRNGNPWAASSSVSTPADVNLCALPVIHAGDPPAVFAQCGWPEHKQRSITVWTTSIAGATTDFNGKMVSLLDLDGWKAVGFTDAGGLGLWDDDLNLVWESSHQDWDEAAASWTPAPFLLGGALRFASGLGIYAYPSGEFIATQPTGLTSRETPSVVDLDLDGSPDIVDGGRVFDPWGNVEWSVKYGSSKVGMLHAVVQADDDPEGEVVWSDREAGGVRLDDTDGTEIRQLAGPEIRPELPCAADFDGDGKMEIAVPSDEGLIAFRLDTGEEMWRFPLDVPLGELNQCTVFDFDGDGAYEVVDPDTTAIHVLDGATGAEVLRIPHNTGGYDLSVSIADMDDDGSADLIVGRADDGVDTGDPSPAMEVYSNPDHVWPPAAPFWPWTTWSGVGEWPDGRLWPTAPTPWLDPGIFRGQPTVVPHGTNLSPEIVSTCEASGTRADAEVRLAVRLDNHGPEPADAGTPLAVYLGDGGGGWRLYDVLTLAAELSADMGSATFELDFQRYQVEDGVRLVAGDDGSGASVLDDCDHDDDELIWTP